MKKGQRHSKETRLKMSQSALVRSPHSKETRIKISFAQMGNKKRLGKIHSKETIEKIRFAKLGGKASDLTRERMRASARRGEQQPHWKGGYANKLHHNRLRGYMRRNAEGSHSFAEWEALKKQYSYMCLCCKQQEPFVKLSEDHIVPLSLGGSSNISNIQPLCGSCNSRKHNKVIDYRDESKQLPIVVFR